MDIKELKVGQIIIGKPTGNNGRYDKSPKEFEVVKIKRKYVDLRIGDGLVDTYSMITGSTQKAIVSGYDGNAGYRFYKSLEEYQEIEMKSSKCCFISEKLRYTQGVMRLPDSLINEIYLELKSGCK